MSYLKISVMKYLLALLCIIGILAMVLTKSKSPPYEPGHIEKTVKCKSDLMERRQLPTADPRPVLYVVTPTYRRVEQVPELTRLGQTLLTVPHLVWMVVEDADACSPHVAALLDRLGIPYVHLASAMPAQYRSERYVPRGVSNRRAAMSWLRDQSPQPTGVMYFLDDDNTIDIRLLEQMRHTKKVSMFPVGLVADYLVSSPIVQEGRVTGWFDGWIVDRQFPVDMAGFAVNLSLVMASDALMPYHAGYEEDKLLRAFGITMDEIEPLANQCTEVLVWHTKTKKNQPPSLRREVASHPNSNIAALAENMERIAMATT
ncbi:galactosylgalactosylxylosylprotein 3-beta-glucuronosyltransferase S-like [Amphibalanus amphitrite]|uniref:galactosylgalactosylxylosylprotein 3-beta-glucuronosyltransferase S-like n=1 Tax=Amphibalanus amphitrite TaxID=1232801 RepID=UPI001C922657|nr:galactosylgalactosylxylosylprotein 3-beta-glucuronosyltransferase S-like [Amphibalanus amphitrite]XP_043204744.1 galactosylgalactosylxylosylprotein 3-beta-glucuronosyltransferase S-like [Amphibalanus amphitrite]